MRYKWICWGGEARAKKVVSILFMRYPKRAVSIPFPSTLFQFSLWDTRNLRVLCELWGFHVSILFMRYSNWHHCIAFYSHLCFNSLYEIPRPPRRCCRECHLNCFNSLYEIQKGRFYFVLPSGSKFQFSLWDTGGAGTDIPQTSHAVSILFMRYKTRL